MKLSTRLFLSTFFITALISIVSNELIYFCAPVIGKLYDASDNSAIVVDDFPIFSELTFQADTYIGNVIRKTLPISLAICLILSLIFSYIFSRIFSKQIVDISKGTIQMSHLNKDYRCPSSSCYEIDLLSSNINQMYESLINTIEDLEQKMTIETTIEKEKVDFLRLASHELKTPVTALLAMLENMMLKIGKYKDYETYIPQCKKQADILCTMISDILNTTKVETLSSKEDFSDTNLSNLLVNFLSSYKNISLSKNQNFICEIEDNIIYKTKENIFLKALSNIISNAIIYTKENKTIKVTLNSKMLTIENECDSLLEDELNHIFEPFYRAETTESLNKDGNGLGLYLTSKILNDLDIKFEFVPSLNKDKMIFNIFLDN